MPKLFVYRIVTDSGIAPHISDGYLTLTICKPGIRKAAQVGDYVLALVALQHLKKTNANRLWKLAYLFKVTEVVPMEAYETWCEEHASGKICSNTFFEGNCQYNSEGTWRPGPHGEDDRDRDLSGKYSLISNFYSAPTSSHPRILDKDERDVIGLTDKQLKEATRNYFTVPLTDPLQEFVLDSIIEEFQESLKPVPVAPVNKNKNKNKNTKKNVNQVGKGGTRKNRKF
jgi:hypothetical protein